MLSVVYQRVNDIQSTTWKMLKILKCSLLLTFCNKTDNCLSCSAWKMSLPFNWFSSICLCIRCWCCLNCNICCCMAKSWNREVVEVILLAADPPTVVTVMPGWLIMNLWWSTRNEAVGPLVTAAWRALSPVDGPVVLAPPGFSSGMRSKGEFVFIMALALLAKDRTKLQTCFYE